MIRYTIMMAIRLACLILAAVVQPLGWHTLVFAAGAVVLPYIAVVIANVGATGTDVAGAEAPQLQIDDGGDTPAASAAAPRVLRLSESDAAEPEHGTQERSAAQSQRCAPADAAPEPDDDAEPAA